MPHKLLSCICLLLGGISASHAQSPACNIPQMDAAMSAQGFQFLNVQGQPCSRYYHNPGITNNWNTAQGQAASVGATLLTISDQAENDAVWQAAVAAGVSGGVWIGYTDQVAEGNWLWEDGNTDTFTSWNSGEPSNSTDICSSTGEDAAVMQMSNGRWNDVYVAPVFPCLFSPFYTSIIKVNLCPMLSVNDGAICNGQSVTLTASATFGSPAYSYSWSSGQAAASISVTPSATTSYAVTSTDRYGCAVSDTATVTVAGSAAPVITMSVDSVCENANVQVSYSGIASPAAVFTWNFDGGTVASGSSAGPYQILWATAGAKNITLTVNDNGCISSQGSASVIVSPPAIADAGPDVSVCTGGVVTLGSTPIQGYTYQWAPSAGLDNPNIANPVFAPTVGTVACVVIATNSDGCADTDTVLVTVTPPSGITLDASGPVTFCSGGSVTLSVAGTYSSYSWSNGSADSGITVTQTGSYSLTAIDAGGCSYVSDTLAVNTSAGNLVIQLDNLRNPTCFGMNDGSITVVASGGTPPYEYSLDGINFQSSGSFTGLGDGTYNITLHDDAGCQQVSSPFSIIAPDSIEISYSINQPTPGASDGAVKVNSLGGTPPYEFSLDGGPYQTSSSFSNMSAGSYLVSVRDSNGCIFADSVTIEELTGIYGVKSESKLKVYPNPASDFIIISSNGNNVNANVSFKLYDSFGKQILQQNSEPNELQQGIIIHLNELNEGIFFLNIKTETGTYVMKVVKY